MSDDINVGAISEALNNKVDLNQLNTSSEGLSYGSGWGMPSDNYEDLTLGASGTTYTAPANGYFFLMKTNGTSAARSVYLTGASGMAILSQVLYSENSACAFMPAKKGDSVIVNYDCAGSYTFKFIYAQGEEVV